MFFFKRVNILFFQIKLNSLDSFFFWRRAFFLKVAFSVWFTPSIAYILRLHFSFFLLRLKSFRPKLFRPIFYLLRDLNLGSFRRNAIFTLTSALINLVVFLLLVLSKLHIIFFRLVLYRLKSFTLRHLMRENFFCVLVCIMRGKGR